MLCQECLSPTLHRDDLGDDDDDDDDDGNGSLNKYSQPKVFDFILTHKNLGKGLDTTFL